MGYLNKKNIKKEDLSDEANMILKQLLEVNIISYYYYNQEGKHLDNPITKTSTGIASLDVEIAKICSTLRFTFYN